MALPATSLLARGSDQRTASPPSGRSALHPDRSVVSPTSPRSSFLGSFIRGRSRAASVTNAVAGAVRGRVASPTIEAPNPMNNEGVSRSISSPPPTAPQVVDLPPIDPGLKRTHRIRLVPVLENHRSFTFEPVQREMGVMHVPPGIVPSIAAASVSDPGPLVNGRAPPLLMKIGRFTDRVASAAAAEAAAAATAAAAAASAAGDSAASGPASGASAPNGANAPIPVTPGIPLVGGGGGDLLSGRAAFRSKVVSRSHAEIWCEPGGKFYIRDTASSSGTFLNHIRLSSPNVQSRPQLLKDGDVLQLGVDYQGGAEEMYRCVKMRVEVGREWQQRGASEFNKKAINQLTALRGETSEKAGSLSYKAKSKSASVTDCCICLFSVAPAQSLFVAPCSHVYHYKCIRPLLMQHHPGFSCPLCRTYANLDEDVEIEDAWDAASRRHSVRSRRNSAASLRQQGAPGAADAPAEDAAAVAGTGSVHAEEGDVLGELSINGVLDVADDLESNELARQTTTVPDLSSSSVSLESGTPHSRGSGTPHNDDNDEATPSRATTTPMAIGGSGRPAPPSRSDTLAVDPVSTSLAQTPMNNVFLSSLVISPNSPVASNDAASLTPAGSGAVSLSMTPEIPEEPVEGSNIGAERAGEAPSISSTDQGHPIATDSEFESHQYLLLED